MELQSTNGLISFGKEFYDLKDELQPSNQVITSQILAQTFPFKLSINLDKELKLESYNLSQNLLFHYCEPMHKEVTQSEFQALAALENFNKDERVFYVPED